MSPQEQADELYYKYSEFDDLNSEEVQRCCCIAIDTIMTQVDTLGKVFWREVKSIIKKST